MRTSTVLAATALIALAATGCRPPATTATDGSSAPGAVVDSDDAGDGRWARTMLPTLAVRAEDTTAGYDRGAWGDWDPVGNGCDTRDLVLREQGSDVHTGPGCQVTGRWDSPYDGVTVTDPAQLQIDHRVPLKEAMRSGARNWTRAEREFFYTDLVNLVAVTSHSNTSKGDKDPGRWQPPHQGHWCAYAAAYITTKYAYHLSVDQREHDALTHMVATCP